ncbi:MAG: hypothetical protein HZB53_18880 [Chloroflexi bacterium]|nr:hypothetical protein [Chloroflexota bacterium]
MENFAIWVLVGDTLLGTVLFVIFALAVKGLAGEIEVEAPKPKTTEKPVAPRPV